MERMGQPQPEAEPHRDGQQQSVDPDQQQASGPGRKANGLIGDTNGIGTRQLRVPVRLTTTKGTTTFSTSHSAAHLQQVHHISDSLVTEHHRGSDHSLLNQRIRASAMLTAKFPRAAELMAKATEDVLAFRHFPPQQWKKIWSTNLLERVNEEIKRCTRVVGIFPNDAAIERLVGAVLLEQDEHWQLEGRRMFSAESMAEIPALEDLPAQACLQEATT